MQESYMGRFHGDEGRHWPTEKEVREKEEKLESDVLNYLRTHETYPSLKMLSDMKLKFGLTWDEVGTYVAMWLAEV